MEFKKTKSTAQRSHRLGKLGEALASLSLASAGFTNIQDLNHLTKNYPFADFLADRDGRRFLISVKARNKFQANGKLNNRYRFKNWDKREHLMLEKCREHQAEAAWVTVQIEWEPKRFNVYFGLISELNGKHAVAMNPEAVAKYECLANDVPHTFERETLENKYERLP